MAFNEKKFLDKAGVSHLWGKIVTKIADDVKVEADRAKLAEEANSKAAAAAQTAADNAQKDATQALTNAKAAQDDVDAVEGVVGDMANVSTTNKTVAGAINELKTAIGAGGTAATITLSTATTTAGMLKSYTLKQGDTTVGVIDIPKDVMVESGSVVENPEGQPAGTYIKLVLANNGGELFINAADLVDIYTAAADATQVQLAVTGTEISATLVDGGVSAEKLATDSVITVKIADKNVTKAKLAEDVQTSLSKADTAVQPAALEAATDRIDVLEGKFGTGEGTVESQIAAALETAAADATSKANVAETNAKAYADSLAGNYDAKGEAQAAYNAIVALSNDEIDAACVITQA